MQGAGDQFFADTRLAKDEYGTVGGCDLVHQCEELLHFRAGADDLVVVAFGANLFLQVAVLLFELLFVGVDLFQLLRHFFVGEDIGDGDGELGANETEHARVAVAGLDPKDADVFGAEPEADARDAIGACLGPEGRAGKAELVFGDDIAKVEDDRLVCLEDDARHAALDGHGSACDNAEAFVNRVFFGEIMQEITVGDLVVVGDGNDVFADAKIVAEISFDHRFETRSFPNRGDGACERQQHWIGIMLGAGEVQLRP